MVSEAACASVSPQARGPALRVFRTSANAASLHPLAYSSIGLCNVVLSGGVGRLRAAVGTAIVMMPNVCTRVESRGLTISSMACRVYGFEQLLGS